MWQQKFVARMLAGFHKVLFYFIFFFLRDGAIRLYLKKIFNKTVHMQFKVGKNVGLPSSCNNKKLKP